ncbi:TRAP transporter large permease [Terasakiella pusilla]|uniref:TRAP transporter large permease n=1 Tax=Terasakiella pusilla TaxID=64973 RepID=UPI003AA7D5E6
MDRVEIGLIGVVAALILIIIRTQVGVAMAVVAFCGIAAITSTKAAWSILTSIPYSFITNWNLSAIPMFLLMGYIASQAGLTSGLFSAARIFLGRVPGGLASSTVIASALFASASGSSVATAAAFSRIAVPEMLKSKYDKGLACGSVAASGTLGSLIPPSILMILFGIFTNTSIESLFVAGVIPGVISALIYIAMITIRVKLKPSLAPRSDEQHSWAEKKAALIEMWPLPTLVICVLGGIFFGLFTPTEAGAIGAALALLIAFVRKQLNWNVAKKAIVETAQGTCTVFFIAIGAAMFSRFLALSRLPNELSSILLPIADSPIILILLIGVIFLILGMFVESISLMLLTIPIILPMLTAMDVNLIWFGIIMVKLLEIGLISPPVGLNVYVMKSSLGNLVPLSTMFKGTFWFLAMDFVALFFLIAIPSLTLWLPGVMK